MTPSSWETCPKRNIFEGESCSSALTGTSSNLRGGVEYQQFFLVELTLITH